MDGNTYSMYKFNYDNNRPPLIKVTENGCSYYFTSYKYCTYNCYRLSSNKEEWELRESNKAMYDDYPWGNIKPNTNISNNTNLFNSICNFCCNCNLYDADTGDVLFLPAPLKVEQVTIQEITQVEEIPQMMGKVMEMIMPIGLIIFGIGLLILLVRLVILRMN